VLIGDELHPPHERPPLSKAVLAGEAAPESTQLTKPEAFEALALEWRRGARVARIDRAAKRLELAGGETLDYDKLILCTGGRARTLSVPGADSAAVYALRRIDDALALAPMLEPGRRVVVIGGGWIGLEVAATARRRAPTWSSSRPSGACASAPCHPRSRSTCWLCIGRMACA
jgi:3-phenylpropionate/trans-cinnamate dioxygenase ferredoxin reductase subunit